MVKLGLISKFNFSLFRTTLNSCFSYSPHGRDKISDKGKLMKGLSEPSIGGYSLSWQGQDSRYIIVRKQRQMMTVAQPTSSVFILSGR